MDRLKILVVDDEPDIVELVSYNLKKDGFVVESASDGEQALNLINRNQYDLVILDLMLPGIQGIDLCRSIRNAPATENLPVIMLTAKTGESDRVLGLEMGADDYLSKPFSIKELIARVRAVLRRSSDKKTDSVTISAGDLIIDKGAYSVTKAGRPLELSSTEFKLLLYLVERRGKVFSRDQLLDALWKYDVFVEPRTVDVHMRRLRMQIEDEPSVPRYIRTMRGVGYYFEKDSL
jgi:phosphate regulon transcriptional regulator PhoB